MPGLKIELVSNTLVYCQYCGLFNTFIARNVNLESLILFQPFFVCKFYFFSLHNMHLILEHQGHMRMAHFGVSWLQHI